MFSRFNRYIIVRHFSKFSYDSSEKKFKILLNKIKRNDFPEKLTTTDTEKKDETTENYDLFVEEPYEERHD